MIFRRELIVLLALAAFAPAAHAQNVTGYDAMADPFLFLIREPAVQRDLGLSATQKQRLIALNETFDGALLKARNTNGKPEEAQAKTQEAFAKSREAVSKIFSDKQQSRLQQIAYRIKGIACVLEPGAVETLDLSTQQQTQIQEVISSTREQISKVSTREYPGEKAMKESQKTIATARRKEQEDIVALLNATQKRKLPALVGKNFDQESLGQVAFKAPELVDSGLWINTDGLHLADLRGKVVALHFFAFG
ncbi:MAG: hypothetical protein AB8B91_06655 [Rubripirellula sp.]